jgi:hypothetical protein
MAEAEKFSITKFFGSFFQWLPWVKTLRYAIGVGAIVFALIFIYKAFFGKTQTQVIRAESGSNVRINQINVVKKTFIPFIEAGVEQRANSDMSTYIRAGLRVEF